VQAATPASGDFADVLHDCQFSSVVCALAGDRAPPTPMPISKAKMETEWRKAPMVISRFDGSVVLSK
jgi:hypothetical protein